MAEDFLYEGKVKKIYRHAPDQVLQVFKDSCSAFNGVKKEEIAGKAEFNARFSAWAFELLLEAGLPSHFIRYEKPNRLITTELKMIPAEVVVRNTVAGSLAKRLSLEEGLELNPPIVEWFYKDDSKNDPQVSVDILVSIYKLEPAWIEEMRSLALGVNSILKERFSKAGLWLVDFKLEFGRDPKGQIVLGDEISPDTCRLWDQETREKLDKDRFRFDLGDLMQGYETIWKKIQASQ